MFGKNQNDIVRIVKANSESVSSGIKANVDSKNNTILIYSEHLQADWYIEDGDSLVRDLPGDRIENFTVLDSGYKPRGRIAPERYECQVSKGNAVKKEEYSSVTYHLSGNNTRIYHDSVDNSSNVVSGAIEGILFSSLVKVIEEQLSGNLALIDLVKEMERNQGRKDFTSAYQNFIAAAANHMTVFAPFLPALSQILK